MSRFNGVDESSFLKGIGTPKNVGKGVSMLADVEKTERIEALEQQLEQHRKQIEDLEEEKRSAGMTTDRVSSDNASSKEPGETQRSGKENGPTESAALEQQNKEIKKELQALKNTMRSQKRENEVEMVNIKTQQKEELKKL